MASADMVLQAHFGQEGHGCIGCARVRSGGLLPGSNTRSVKGFARSEIWGRGLRDRVALKQDGVCFLANARFPFCISGGKSSRREGREGDWREIDVFRSGEEGREVRKVFDVKSVSQNPGDKLLKGELSKSEVQRENEGAAAMGRNWKVKQKIRRKELAKVKVASSNLPSCYGCGTPLQTSSPEAPGFVPTDTFEVKKKHHQLRTLLCGRCRLLTQGHMIPAVGGVGGYGDGKGFILAEELRAQLTHLRLERALIVKLVDIVDFNGSFLARVRDLVGANPIILVATKVDLLPERTNMAAISDWLTEATLRKKLNVISIHLTSSKANIGINRVAADIQRQRQGRDVYVLGSANVGKSAFISALLGEMSKRDPVAAAALRHKPVQSAMPGTTLAPIKLKAFAGSGNLYDTPGVHLHHRVAAVINPQDLPHLAPRHRIRGYCVGSSDQQETDERTIDSEDEVPLLFDRVIDDDRQLLQDTFLNQKDEFDNLQGGAGKHYVLEGLSLFWGGIARLDVVKAPPNLRLAFYGPNGVRIHKVSMGEAEKYYKENLGKTLIPPTDGLVEKWSGLQCQQNLMLKFENGNSPAGDISISGLGWVTVERSNSMTEIMDTSLEADPSISDVVLVIHTPKSVEVFVRPTMPVGVKAQGWYKYADLSDEELEARPRVFY